MQENKRIDEQKADEQKTGDEKGDEQKNKRAEEEEVVSRAEYERLRLEMTAERFLSEAGARNLRAAMALLDWADLDCRRTDWAEILRKRVWELRRQPDAAFLFTPDWRSQDCRWLGLQPQAAGDSDEVCGEEGVWGLRFAQAEGVEAIKIKQEAAALGIIL